MDENTHVEVNPENVNPHFQRPEEFGLKPLVKNPKDNLE